MIYLGGLRGVLEDATGPCLLGGDWNQRIPRMRQPKRVFRALEEAIPRSFDIATSGLIPGLDRQVIDHLAITGGLEVEQLTGIPKDDPNNGQLSDHDGVVVDIA